MKYYLVEFRNNYAICSRTIRTKKTIKDIEKWINKQNGLFKNTFCSFIKAEEVTKDDFKSFIKCFEKTKQNEIKKLSTI